MGEWYLKVVEVVVDMTEPSDELAVGTGLHGGE